MVLENLPTFTLKMTQSCRIHIPAPFSSHLGIDNYPPALIALIRALQVYKKNEIFEAMAKQEGRDQELSGIQSGKEVATSERHWSLVFGRWWIFWV